MLEQLLQVERNLFLYLNGSDSVYLDHFWWLFSGKAVWLPLAAILLGILLYKKKLKEGLFLLVAIALVITLCDQFASHLCKPLFMRYRPTHHPDFMNIVKTVFDYRGGKYGFISSHAANAFGFAAFLSLLMRNKFVSLSIFVWAILTAYSRVYLGVHFISDIVAGALAGLFFGYLVYYLYRRVLKEAIVGYTIKQKNTVSIAIVGSIFLLLLLSPFLITFV